MFIATETTMLRTLLLCAFLLTSAASAATAVVPKHLEEANSLLKSLKPEDTSYQHGTPDVKWKGSKGAKFSVCHTDCSGFIQELILHSYPKYNVESLKKWFGVKKRPLAHHYYDTVMAQKGFTRIEKISQVLPGDLIVFKYKPGKTGDNSTGHVMLVVAKPKKHPASDEIIKHTTQWEVPIMDETRSGHGETDSRYKGKNKGKRVYPPGLGTGSLRLYTHKDGTMEGYSWSLDRSSKHYDTQEVPLVIGRLDPKFQP
jgi:hypothetical protein